MKAIGLLSGGLDSILAAKIVADQGIEVIALSFTTPFFKCTDDKLAYLKRTAKVIGVKLEVIDVTSDYIKMLKKPKHGYGKNLNPCIDCKILMLKKAKQYAKKVGAKFVFTGEVLGQRPMSQRMDTLRIIEKEAGLKGKLLRPLSAKFMPITEAEKKGWIDRNRLLQIQGRGRNPQIDLAKIYSIKEYQSPAGGCLLTCGEYCKKVTDLLKHNKKILSEHIDLLKIGRHFRLDKNKIIVGRNEKDNLRLAKLKHTSDYLFEVPNCGSPITLLQGKKSKQAILLAAKLTVRYSDADKDEVIVVYGKDKMDHKLKIIKPKSDEFDKYKI
jgi:tRNA-specific 2-thiouridylase